MGRTYCYWCHSVADWIDQASTKCPECPDAPPPEKMQLVSRQTADGVKAGMRARLAKEAEKPKTK